MQALDAVVYGDNKLVFHVLFAERKTMEIAVHPDSSIVVKAPRGTAMADIRQRVRRRARWITGQMGYFQQFSPRTPGRQYLSGETHLYLGRQYRLKVVKGDETGVKLTRGHLVVTYEATPDPFKIRSLLEQWYLERARRKYVECLERCFTDFKRMGYAQPTVHIRRMKTRWGSLSSKGTLTLNRDLIRAPRDCIDYVITHELCHLKYKDHSNAFYRLMEKVMPDWDKRKHRLELVLA